MSTLATPPLDASPATNPTAPDRSKLTKKILVLGATSGIAEATCRSGQRSQEGVSEDAPGVVAEVRAQRIGPIQGKAESKHDGSAHLNAVQAADQAQREHEA